MRLNLHDIIGIPGTSKAFEYPPEISDLEFESVTQISEPYVSGKVANEAGVLRLSAELSVKLSCQCARCLKDFEKTMNIPISAVVADELLDEDNVDIFLLSGDYVDLDEIVTTAFVLEMDQKLICDEDCKGLCCKCGKNLNDGPCECMPEKDPRFAVLGQFLEKE